MKGAMAVRTAVREINVSLAGEFRVNAKPSEDRARVDILVEDMKRRGQESRFHLNESHLVDGTGELTALIADAVAALRRQRVS